MKCILYDSHKLVILVIHIIYEICVHEYTLIN